MAEFAAAMAKLHVLGQDTSKLIDCSEVVPTPAALSGDIIYKVPAYVFSGLHSASCTFILDLIELIY